MREIADLLCRFLLCCKGKMRVIYVKHLLLSISIWLIVNTKVLIFHAELGLLFFQVLLWLLSYICWSWHDLPIHCECVCSARRYPLMGCNVASHCQEEGELVPSWRRRLKSTWTAGLQGKHSSSYSWSSFAKAISLSVALTEHRFFFTKKCLLVPCYCRFLFPLLWFLGMVYTTSLRCCSALLRAS